MVDTPGELPEYEEFGVHKLLLSSSNISGYRDVHFLKNRKEKPWQAKVWRPWARDHIQPRLLSQKAGGGGCSSRRTSRGSRGAAEPRQEPGRE